MLSIDLHSGQCVGYFDIPVDHVYGEGVLLDYLASKRIPNGVSTVDNDLFLCCWPCRRRQQSRGLKLRAKLCFLCTLLTFAGSYDAGDLVVVSPDVGGVARARAFAKKLSDAPLAIVDKRRSAHNVSEVMNIIGDVRGKVAVLVDDMIDTAGTITNAGKVLHEEGAKAVYACATHAVFSPPAAERLSSGASP